MKKSTNKIELFKGINAHLVLTFWPYLHFDPYLFISPLLVSKLKKSYILVHIVTNLTEISYVANGV